MKYLITNNRYPPGTYTWDREAECWRLSNGHPVYYACDVGDEGIGKMWWEDSTGEIVWEMQTFRDEEAPS